MNAAAKKASKGKSKPVATKSKPKTKAAKPAGKKPAAKKPAPAKKAPAAKPAAKKPGGKQAPPQKAVPKKPAAKQPAPTKVPAKPVAAKVAPAKPVAAKVAPAKPVAAKVVPAKPVAAKVAPAKPVAVPVPMLKPAKLMPAKLAPAQPAPAAKKPARHAPPRADFGAPVEGFFAAQPPELRVILDALRELIEEAAPEAHASLKWGQPFYTLNSAMMCALGAHAAHVNLILVGGPDAFDDPDNQLLGAGTASRHLRLTSLAELPRERVRKWLAVSARYASNRGGYTGPRSR